MQRFIRRRSHATHQRQQLAKHAVYKAFDAILALIETPSCDLLVTMSRMYLSVLCQPGYASLWSKIPNTQGLTTESNIMCPVVGNLHVTLL